MGRGSVHRIPAWVGPALGAVAALWLAGCLGAVRLSERRQAYTAAFAPLGAAQTDADARSALLQGLLQRTHTPYAAPYPDLVQRQRALADDLDALKRDRDQGVIVEGDFDAFAQGKALVLTKRSPDWPGYQALDTRFQALSKDFNAQLKAFDAERDAFDELAHAHGAVHLDPTALGPTLDGVEREFKDGLHHMEDKIRLDQAAVSLLQGTTGAPVLLANEQNALLKMQTHLFRSGGLATRALLLSAKLRHEGPAPDGLWAGPGLPNDGQDWVHLMAERAAFRRRRREFKALAQAFSSLQASVPESVPVR